jgi:putative phosphoesterase
MKILVLSDIHANLDALSMFHDEIKAADAILCIGDIIGYYVDVNEVIEIIRAVGAIAVCGNHEHFLNYGVPKACSEHVQWGIDYATAVISEENLQYLQKLPLLWSGVLDGCKFLIAHGSPWNPIADYMYEDSEKISQLTSFDVDFVIIGQTHRPWIDDATRPIVINAGSVGQSRHKVGVATAILIDSKSKSVDILERDYDTKPMIERCVMRGASNWVNKHLVHPHKL